MLDRQYRARPNAESALQLASGEWKCGDYAAALSHFILARDLGGDDPDTHVSLVHAASMLGSRELEAQALDAAMRRHPQEPRLRLHAARRRIPGDPSSARALLAPVLADPICAQFDSAIAMLLGDNASSNAHLDERGRARLEGLRWVLRQNPPPEVHVGLATDVLFRALETAPADGLTLECGVYFGRSLDIIAKRTPGMVHGFDSFQGLPEAWSANEGAGAYSTAGRLPPVRRNVALHPGWFEESLPAFFAANAGPIRLLHVDCDLYSSTRTVLTCALERQVPGSVIVFDDLLGYPGFEQHELRALEEFTREYAIEWELVAASLLGREVAIRIRSNPRIRV